MVIASTPVMPSGWRVDSVEAIVPLALTVSSHLLYPGECCLSGWSSIVRLADTMTCSLFSGAEPLVHALQLLSSNFGRLPYRYSPWKRRWKTNV